MELFKSNNPKLKGCKSSIILIKIVYDLIKAMNSRTQNGALRINSPEENVRLLLPIKKNCMQIFMILSQTLYII